MPRARTPNPPGAPAGRYPNRTDIAAQKASGTQPVRTATGQPYGNAGAQAAAQRAFPLPQPAETPSPGAGAAVERIPGTMTPAAAQAYTPPSFGLSTLPSQRPNEPVTAGISSGPGPGPDPFAQGAFSGAALLAALAAARDDPELRALANLAEAQGF